MTGLTTGSVGLGKSDNASDASQPLRRAATNAMADKAGKQTIYTKNDSDIQIGLCIDLNNAALSSQYATIASLDNKHKLLVRQEEHERKYLAEL